MTTDTKNAAPPADAGNAPAADPGKAPPADAGNNPPADAGKAPAADAPKQYRPEGIPDHYVGANDAETIDKLFKANEGFRREQGKAKGIPEKYDDYKITLPDEVTSKMLQPGEDGKDPVFEAMSKTFFENQVPAEIGAKIMEKIYEEVSKLSDEQAAGLPATDYEYKTHGGPEKAKPLIDANRAWLQGLVTQKKISEKTMKELELATFHSEGLAALDELRTSLGGEKPIPANLSAQSPVNGMKTEAELSSMMRDPRYWQAGKKDPAFIQEVTEGFQKLYATQT